jgi:hypothetical protein
LSAAGSSLLFSPQDAEREVQHDVDGEDGKDDDEEGEEEEEAGERNENAVTASARVLDSTGATEAGTGQEADENGPVLREERLTR